MYSTSISNKKFNVLAYSLESSIAEKFETFVARGINNSRSKDLIDLYLLEKTNFNIDVLNSALVNTFYYRNTLFDKDFINQTIEDVFSFERTKELFENYCKKNKYAKNIDIDDCKRSITNIFSKIVFEPIIYLKDYNVTLHLIRHGEDEQDKVGGWSDNHLTNNGKKQISNLVNLLDDDYDLFISSDLNRAKETSFILNEKLQMDIQFNQMFRETNNGKFRNMSKANFIDNYKQFIFSKLKMDESYPEGESPLMFFERIKSNFIDLLEKNRNKKILIVTHGGVITIIQCLLNGYKYSNLLKISPPLGSITKY